MSIPDGKEDAGWEELRKQCPDLSKWGVNVLRTGLDGFAKSVVVERRYVCKDYRNIFSHFYSKKFAERSSLCSRLHVFRSRDLKADEVVMQPDTHQEAYIGFSIVQPVGDPVNGRCLGRTVLDPYRCGRDPGTFYCLSTSFGVHLQGAEYKVRGYPYVAQSGEATVCAHSALWGVCRYLSERYTKYSELYPYDLIKMAGDTSGRRVPYHGLNYTDYSTILSNFGCHPIIRRPKTFGPSTKWTEDKETFLDIYAYVESGFPVLLSFRGHVATAIGHTVRKTLGFNLPDANGFHDSYALIDQYVIVDDNFFPYQLLGDRSDGKDRNYGRGFESSLKPHPSKEDIFAAVAPLPEKAFMEPKSARTIGARFFAKVKTQLAQILADLGLGGKDPLITRLFLTSGTSFKKRKRDCFTGKAGIAPDFLSQFTLKVNLPHFVWVMEISPLALYNQHLIIGEVVVDASADMTEEGFVYARIGNTLIQKSRVSTAKSAAQKFSQYTHNLGERP